jgi:hypothetical protein
MSFLSTQHSFLSKFTKEEGTIEVVLNATVPMDEGKLFDLRLDPFLLREISQRNVSLRVQVWNS